VIDWAWSFNEDSFAIAGGRGLQSVEPSSAVAMLESAAVETAVARRKLRREIMLAPDSLSRTLWHEPGSMAGIV
jgi:hypothetical protein